MTTDLAPLDVTVVTPTFNRAGLITRALDSVRTQRRPPAGIVVVDDASHDGTADVVRRWGQATGFPVKVEVMARNGGPAIARNRGIELATTPYVAFLDSDDEHLPHTLERLVGPLEKMPDAVVSFADATIVTPTGSEPHGLFRQRIDLEADTEALAQAGPAVRGLRNATDILLKASILPTSATCFRRDAALAAGLMPADFRSGEDWLFWLRMSAQGRFVFQLDDLARHHRHDDNLTHARAAEFMAREKLRGFLALLDGSIGITITNAQAEQIRFFVTERAANWRYHLSRLGTRTYFHGLNSSIGKKTGGVFKHLVADPRSALRGLTFSARKIIRNDQ